MKLRADVFVTALRVLDEGRGVAIAAVTGASGSTPRHLGARMAVASDGEQWGTVGGGRIEQLVAEAAREVAGGAAPRVVRQHLVRDLAMCCGGSMEVVLTPAAPSRATIAALASGSRQRTASASSRPTSSGDGQLSSGASACPMDTTWLTRRVPSASDRNCWTTAPRATRAAVSRALARSSTGRASSKPYFCIPARSA